MLRDFKWAVNAGATEETELKTKVTSFGDGYEQVSSVGINNARKSWNLTTTAYADEINEIYDFIVAHRGIEPFLLNLSGKVEQYRTEGNISRTHVSGNVWSITFTVKQTFIPQ